MALALRVLLLLLTLALPARALELAPPMAEALPDLRFLDMQGNETGLDAFKGKVVVLNLWATWCAPCREEMPGLDRLQAMFPKDRLLVVALSVDRAGADRVQNFLDEIGVSHLSVYRDPKAATARALRLPGLPATLLLDRDGREQGRVLGIAEWDGPDAVALVQKLLGEAG